jgi:hypothetical protein
MAANSTTSITPAASDLRDIKPPVEIASPWEWVWWTLGVLALLAVAYFIWRSLQKRRLQVPAIPLVPAHVRAKQKLGEALILIGQPKPFCILVSDTVRAYLEERFNFRAPERTTEEFLHELSDSDLLLPDQKESLGQFLEQCDLVKFAKYEPGETELRGMHASAVRLVEETEPETKAESGRARVSRAESGVTPDSSTTLTALTEKLDERGFRRDAENGTRDARAPQNRKS